MIRGEKREDKAEDLQDLVAGCDKVKLSESLLKLLSAIPHDATNEILIAFVGLLLQSLSMKLAVASPLDFSNLHTLLHKAMFQLHKAASLDCLLLNMSHGVLDEYFL